MGHSFQIPPLRPSRSYKTEFMVKLGSVKDYKVQKPRDAGSVLILTRSLPQSASRVIDSAGNAVQRVIMGKPSRKLNSQSHQLR